MVSIDLCNLRPFIGTKSLLQIISESSMGAAVNAQTNSDSKYVNAVKV